MNDKIDLKWFKKSQLEKLAEMLADNSTPYMAAYYGEQIMTIKQFVNKDLGWKRFKLPSKGYKAWRRLVEKEQKKIDNPTG